ncbi:Formate/nitrite transporter [Plenodomus tracheiphilus IPT5]|uniref:Formate/nitrite transporter n=1 Tax=Plenodomus tracheiphilus IPT5 TaxID=1408161 RepID=A0A6A7BCM7_9PLEO|nr:Formate/nitrite transporter [Plenodomus tracheiphilus IPT5]
MSESQHRKLAPPTMTSNVDCHTPVETLRLAEQAAIAKAHLSWTDLIIKSFLGGVFISLGAAFDLVIVGGSPGLRASNPALATLLGALCFPIGFAIIILFNMELCTSNMFVMAYGALRRRITIWDLTKNWVVSYFGNIAGCLFYAGILCYWCDTLSTPAQQSYAATQADGRVNVNWGYSVSRGIMCNWLVGVAFIFATEGRDFVSKIVGIWIAITTFVAMGFQHSIANYLMVPIGMMYGGTNFGVGKFIWASCIPVTIGNIIGGAFFGAFSMWMVYGRHEQSVREIEREAKDTNGV